MCLSVRRRYDLLFNNKDAILLVDIYVQCTEVEREFHGRQSVFRLFVVAILGSHGS